MKKIFHEGLQTFKIVVIPAFLFVCLDFLYRVSEMNVVRDAVLSFAFMELGLMVIAAVATFALVFIKRLVPFKLLDKLIVLTVAYCAVSLVLLYFKWWIFSFTIADERGLIVIRFYYVFLAAILVTAAGVYLAARKSWMLNALKEAGKRFAVLVLIVSVLSFGILSYGVLSHGLKSEAKASLESSPDSPRFNILLIVVDTLTAHAFSSYGYKENSTPFFDKLAREAYFFRNARADVTVTGPSITTILTGRSPLKSHILGYYAVPSSALEKNLLTLFERAGYRTESLVQSKHALTYSMGLPSPTEGEANALDSRFIGQLNRGLSRLCRKLGFSLKFRFKSPNKLYWQFSESFELIHKRLQRLSKQQSPFFLYTHIYFPYHVPDYFYYGNETNTEESRRRIHYDNFYPPERQGAIDQARRAYDRAVSHLDYEMGLFLESLKKGGILDKTIVVFTADHGESFENGYWGHGNDFSESSIQVPLYIVMPSGGGKVIEQPVMLSDIAPTILHLNHMSIPEWMDGIPALDEARKRQTAVTFNSITDEPVGTRVPYPGFSTGRSIVLYDSGYKFILNPKGKDPELYHLFDDPNEKKNLYSKLPEKSKALHAKLISLVGI